MHYLLDFISLAIPLNFATIYDYHLVLPQRTHNLAELRERLNEGAKRMNRLPLSPVVISYATVRRKPLLTKHCRTKLVPGPIRALQKFVFGLHLNITPMFICKPKTNFCRARKCLGASSALQCFVSSGFLCKVG